MAQYPLGIIVRQRREALGLSQQQLCQGICDRSTLSRIERGDQVPSYYTLHALLQRLGMREKDICFLLSQPDFETAAACRLQLFPPAGPGAPLRGVHRGGGDRAAVLRQL